MDTIVIENRRPALIGPPIISLHPGENDVPIEIWNRFRTTKVGQMLRAVGWVKERKDIKKATPLVENLSVVEQEKALALIQSCKSQELLRRWAKNDSRSKSQVAIQRRLDAFAVPGAESQEPEPAAENEAAKGRPASRG